MKNYVVRVYLDEDVSVLLASLLQARQVDALTARDLNMLGKTDEQQLYKAIESDRILLTHNRIDFENLYSRFISSSVTQPGIIVLSRKRDIYSLANRLIRFFYQHPTISNQLWYL